MGLFVKKEKMNMKSGRFEPVNFTEKKKKKILHGSPIYKSMKPQIRELKEKEKMQKLENRIKRLNKRDTISRKKAKIRSTKKTIMKRQLEPYSKAGSKIISGAKKLEKWGNSFDKTSRSPRSSKSRKGKTVLMVDSSGRIVGSRKIKSQKRNTSRSSGDYGDYVFGSSGGSGSGINSDYFFGSSRSSGKKKSNKKNNFDNIGGWI